jgi:hypothetical protein
VPNACKSHGVSSDTQWRTAEEHVGIDPTVGDNVLKGALIPHTLRGGKRACSRGRTTLRPIRLLAG